MSQTSVHTYTHFLQRNIPHGVLQRYVSSAHGNWYPCRALGWRNTTGLCVLSLRHARMFIRVTVIYYHYRGNSLITTTLSCLLTRPRFLRDKLSESAITDDRFYSVEQSSRAIDFCPHAPEVLVRKLSCLLALSRFFRDKLSNLLVSPLYSWRFPPLSCAPIRASEYETRVEAFITHTYA